MGYHNYVNASKYCYAVVTKKLTWSEAKLSCREDGGDLACFGNQQERDYLTSKCDGCWVGYNWKNGTFINNFFFVVTYTAKANICYDFRCVEANFLHSGYHLSRKCRRRKRLEKPCWNLCKDLVHIIK